MTKIIEHWLLFEYVGLEFTPLSKPFKTREQAEKAREKYPERPRKRIGVGAKNEHGQATAADFCALPAIRLKVQMEADKQLRGRKIDPQGSDAAHSRKETAVQASLKYLSVAHS
jgi:hypothetical protein